MANCDIAKEALKVVVGQICQKIGWHAIRPSPLNILVDILGRYIFEISKSVHDYTSQCNRTESNLDDVAVIFQDFGIVLQEVADYINNVESVPLIKIAALPVKHPSKLQLLKTLCKKRAIDDVKNSLKKRASGVFSSFINKYKLEPGTSKNNLRVEYCTEEKYRPMLEMPCVIMTPEGIVSLNHEGKRPDASLPCLVDSPPLSPEVPSHSFTPASPDKDSKLENLEKDKSSKPKKGKSSKSKKVSGKRLKKLKSSKKEKKNKKNAVGKHKKTSTSSSSSEEDHVSSHSSETSTESDELVGQKSKSDKMEPISQEDDLGKVNYSFKLSSKLKAKFKKHPGGSGSSSKVKSSSLEEDHGSSHSSETSTESDESVGQKSKSNKMEQMSQEEDLGKVNYSFKLGSKLKAKFKKHPGGTGSSSNVESLKLSLKKSKARNLPRIKHIKVEEEVSDELLEVEEEKVSEEMLYNAMEESPEEWLIVDDSPEIQARQERESSPEEWLIVDDYPEIQARQERESSPQARDKTISIIIRRGKGD